MTTSNNQTDYLTTVHVVHSCVLCYKTFYELPRDLGTHIDLPTCSLMYITHITFCPLYVIIETKTRNTAPPLMVGGRKYERIYHANIFIPLRAVLCLHQLALGGVYHTILGIETLSMMFPRF